MGKHRSNEELLAEAEERLAQLVSYRVGQLGATLGLPPEGACVLATRWLCAAVVSAVLGPKPVLNAKVCRRCSNKVCINVKHLFWGSPRDSMRNKVLKGRGKSPYAMTLARVVERIAKLKARVGKKGRAGGQST